MRVAWLFLLALSAPAGAQTPAAAVDAAALDAARVRSAESRYVRYLSLYDVADPKELTRWDQLLRFWANSLSREVDLTPPTRVTPNLWRVDLRDYGWDAKVWEKLADTEPYFLVKLTAAVTTPATTERKYWPGGVNSTDGKHYDAGWYDVVTPAKAAAKVAFGPQVDGPRALTLAAYTGSAVPVVKLNWWITEATRANDRGTGYYSWLGLGAKEADFLKLVGADVKEAQRLRREIGAIVSRSPVTLNNRGLERFDAISGPYWRSRDYARNNAEKNALRLLDGDIQEDASEQYGSLPNRLFAFWLQNNKGERQDTAPDNIASDGKSTGTDRRVAAGMNCVRCHVEGIRPINDWARKVYSPPFSLDDRDDREQRRKRSKYLSDLVDQTADDNARYAKVLTKTNGLTAAANAKLVGDLWDQWVERDRSLADVAREIGADPGRLTAALKAEAKRTQLDPILAGLVQGVDARLEHVEELVPLLHEILGRHGH
ncbi:hypothetical protein [Limnoglobus roseus]|uniref:Cytochrome c domain-containing protein n=1 Tax=Limnoglobus roseus TaxID=2598579 RepID=A0A5C1AH25_9BACT|nr:hypothetical protein [Limnoglobus roseus]QEL18521.1 hypothetical protein PX52LOC_05548 [Limnoglobus roseus]